MKQFTRYCSVLLTVFLLGTSYQGWGRGMRPLPCFKSGMVVNAPDTVPVRSVPAVKQAEAPKNPVKEIIEPVIKAVPKSRKQIKPMALPGNTPVRTPKVIKPKVIIRKIGGLTV